MLELMSFSLSFMQQSPLRNHVHAHQAYMHHSSFNYELTTDSDGNIVRRDKIEHSTTTTNVAQAETNSETLMLFKQLEFVNFKWFTGKTNIEMALKINVMCCFSLIYWCEHCGGFTPVCTLEKSIIRFVSYTWSTWNWRVGNFNKKFWLLTLNAAEH